MKMYCPTCQAEFKRALKLDIIGEVTKTRIVCPVCKSPGPTFKIEEHPDYEEEE